MKTTRCKMICQVKEANGDSEHVKLTAVSKDGCAENEEFFKYTPGGSLEFWSVNPAATQQLEVGKEYYVDISLAE